MATLEERVAALEAKFARLASEATGANGPVNTGAYVVQHDFEAPLRGCVRLPYVEALYANGLEAELNAKNINPPRYFMIYEVMDDAGLSEQAVQNIAINTLANAGNSMLGSFGNCREAIKRSRWVRSGDGTAKELVWWDRSESVVPGVMGCESRTALEAGYEVERKLRQAIANSNASTDLPFTRD